MKRTRHLFVATGAVLLLLHGSAAFARDFPLRGVITNPWNDTVAVRVGPPTATAFSYMLADQVCEIGSGTEFIGSEESYIANGEIWFRINTTKVVGSVGCPAAGATGWIVAKLKKETWLVTIVEEGISVPEQPIVQQTIASERAAAQYEAKKGEESRKENTSYKPIFDYFLLILGTLIGVIVVAIERTKDISRKSWLTSFIAFEFVLLSTVNSLSIALLIDQLYQVSEPSFLFQVLRIAQASPGGFVLLGFILSAVLLRFIAFAKS